jgi:hypothetical protein
MGAPGKAQQRTFCRAKPADTVDHGVTCASFGTAHGVSLMRIETTGRLFGTAAVVVCLSVGVATQDKQVKERTKIETDDAKIVTWTGCLRASDDGFDLTEVTGDPSKKGSKEPRPPNMVMLRQIPTTVDLQKYVGHRVAVTGAAEKDVFEDIEVKVQTEKTVEQKARPEMRTKSKAEVEVDPSGHNILVPISVREISKTCL